MINLLDIYKLINSKIEEICSNSFADYYPEEKKKIYPYVEFKFPSTQPNGFSELNSLDIDIWNNKANDIFEIETITENIDKQLNKLQVNNETMQLCIFRNNPYKLRINDPDIHIQRRQLRYILKVYYK